MDDAEIIARVAALETQVKSLEARTNVMNDLLVKVTELCTKMDNLIKAQNDLTARLTALEKEPVDKWQLTTRTVITAIITAALTYLGSRFMK